MEQAGYRILERNFYCRQGELDIVAKQAEYLVFVEVKYRKTGVYGAAEAAVDKRKQNRMAMAAAFYLYKRGLSAYTPCRFDVVAINGGEITLFQNAF